MVKEKASLDDPIKNLKLAIRVLKRIKRKGGSEHFNMNYFVTDTLGLTHPYVIVLSEKNILDSCGTVCCISGWLAVSEEFKDLRDESYSICFSGFKLPNMSTEASIAKLFDIPLREAVALVFPQSDDHSHFWTKEEHTFPEKISLSKAIKVLEGILAEKEGESK